MEKIASERKPSALLPIGIFLIIFIGSGIVMNDFYSMPAIVGFLIALLVAFLQNPRLDFENKFRLVAKEIGRAHV